MKKNKKPKPKPKSTLGKVWYFIWEEDSIWSWLVNVILAFVLIKFIIYPGLGFVLGTSHPIVAVVSGSMEHKIALNTKTNHLEMCGNVYENKRFVDFDYFWDECKDWYSKVNITKEQFTNFPLRNGFNKGDIIFLRGKQPKDIKIGHIIVFRSHSSRPKPDPIIHRVVSKYSKGGSYHFQTKGDHNEGSINACERSGCIDETDIAEQQIIGNTFFRVPYLGYVKIWFVDFVCLFNNFNFCIR